MTAPERIWAASVTENYGEWQTTTDGLPRPTEYVRADLYAALEAQLAEAKAENERLKIGIEKAEEVANKLLSDRETQLWHRFKEMLSALEATPAPKVTEAMVKAFQEKYREFWKGSWPSIEASRELLKAAMEAGR